MNLSALQATSFRSYSDLPGVNWSSLRELRKSPRHYQHYIQTERPDKGFLLLGRAVHCSVFEPDEFPLRFTVWPGKRAGKSWDSFKVLNMGRDILKRDEYDLALGMRNAVREHPLVAPYLAAGVAERAVTWTDPVTGLGCKARPDWISTSKPAVVDLKTSRAIDVRGFSAAVARYGYHCQLAMYRAGVKAATGLELDAVLVAVESAAPHDVAVFKLDEDVLYAADEELRELMDRLKGCHEAGAFPGRYEGEQALHLPAWAFPDYDFSAEEAG